MTASRHKLKSASRAITVGAVVVSPWLFGSAEPWAYLIVCMLVAVGSGIWLITLWTDSEPHIRAPGLVWALLALLMLVFLQMRPLPRPLAKILSPLSEQAQSEQAQIFEKVAVKSFLPPDVEIRPGKATLSVSAGATWRSFCLLTAYLCVFLVMVNTIVEWPQFQKTGKVIAISGFVMAVFALLQKYSGTTDIYWFHTPRFGGVIFGPFTNRDHFAAYMSMSFGLTLGLLLAAMRTPEMRLLRTWRERIAWLSTGAASRITLLAFAAVLMGAAVFMTLSRGGIASLAAAVGIVAMAAALRDFGDRRARIMGAVSLLVLAAVVWLGWQPVVERVGTLFAVAMDPMSDVRATATLDTLRMFWASPLVGCGFGAFHHLFSAFQSPSIQFGRFMHAHNDYAQLLAEGGLVGAGVAVLIAAFFVRSVRRRFASATTHGKLALAGLAVSILAIALHSLVDFSLHKPANGFLFAALCGMAVSAVHLRRGRRVKKLGTRRHHELATIVEDREPAESSRT